MRLEPTASRHLIRNTVIFLLIAALLSGTMAVVFLRVKAPRIYHALTNQIVASAQQPVAKLRWR